MPALIPLALALAPQMASWLFGASAAQATASVAAAAAAVTGTRDPDAQLHALADPDKAAAFTLELHKLAAGMQAEQHQADLAAMQAQFADVASARSQTLSLMQAHSSIAWGAPIVSAVVLVVFGTMLGIILFKALPPGSEALANVMLGSLAGMATNVAGYWIGSSAGSRAKDNTIASANDALANSVPVSATKS